jgi:hypothetical protein
MAATKTASTTSSSTKLVTPHNTSEFHAMAEAARRLFHTQHDQLVTISAELRRDLAAIGGSPMLLGLDGKLAARKVARHLAVAAGYQLASAQAVIRSWTEYQRLYLGRPENKRGFDINK